MMRCPLGDYHGGLFIPRTSLQPCRLFGCQHPNGFYVVIPCRLTGCINPVYGLRLASNINPPKDPLIPATQFTSVSDMQYNNRESLMYVNLYDPGRTAHTQEHLVKPLPDATHGALMIDDDVVTGSFDSGAKEVTNSILSAD